MNFSYRFPAVKGIQAGREYYISMVPLKLLSRLFPAEEEIVLPEHRAQRRINEARIPEIKNYILDNRDTYVFSPFLPPLMVSSNSLHIWIQMQVFLKLIWVRFF